MAGALSLQEDIWTLVNKHRESCLPEDLLARLAEDARLLACGERIRSLHQADPFGLFSELRDDEEEVDGGDVADEGTSGGGGRAGAAVLPDSVKHMLEMMKINRLDKVAALNGFSTIDAEVEFSRTKKPATRDGNCSPGAPTLSAATTAAAAEAAVAEARAEEEAAGADLSSEEGEADAEAPVFLTFRFRREPLSRGTAEREPEPEPDTPATGGSSGEITNLTMGDEEEEAPAVAATSNGHRGGGDGGGEVNDGCTDPLREENSVTACTPADGGKGISGSSSVGNNGGAKEGRKRAGSRGSECEGKGGGDKGSKRAKSAGGAGGAAEKDDEEVEEEEEDGDGEEEQLDGAGLGYEPRTIVSYSISGGIGFDPAEILLQAVVYARGDGPACVMPPPRSGAHQDDDDDDDDEEGSVLNEQEDAFDCNVDGPALAAVGRALGLHTGDEEPPPSDSDSDSDSESGEGGGGGAGGEELRKKREKKGQPSRLSAGSDIESEGLEPERGELGGMTLSDLVWWLLMFPFFEKEFDMVEVVASSVFGEDDSDDSDDGGGGESGESDSSSEDGDGDG